MLPALACALALIVTFIATGAPVDLGVTLIAAGLILRRAGPSLRREPVPSLISAAHA